jgi:hypothetical protein
LNGSLGRYGDLLAITSNSSYKCRTISSDDNEFARLWRIICPSSIRKFRCGTKIYP